MGEYNMPALRYTHQLEYYRSSMMLLQRGKVISGQLWPPMSTCPRKSPSLEEPHDGNNRYYSYYSRNPLLGVPTFGRILAVWIYQQFYVGIGSGPTWYCYGPIHWSYWRTRYFDLAAACCPRFIARHVSSQILPLLSIAAGEFYWDWIL